MPHGLEMRFKLYLSILPIVEKSAIYLCFIFGVLLMILAFYKYLKLSKNNVRKTWFDGDFGAITDNKFNTYLPEKRGKMTQQEFDKYYGSLVTPISQELITYEDFQNSKEADILE